MARVRTSHLMGREKKASGRKENGLNGFDCNY